MDELTSALWTALTHTRATKDHYDLANQMINRGANVNEAKKTFCGVITLLHYAAVTGDVLGMRLLISHGANVHAGDTMNRTPLHYAVHPKANIDRPDVVEVLINEGAVVDARTIYQMTPLHMAVRWKFNKSAEKLIDRGASIDAVDTGGRSILHTAVLFGNLSIIKVLIRHKVNIDPKDYFDGRTPLHLAIKEHGRCNVDIIQLLLENGADAHTKSRKGSFPLYSAVWDWRALYFLLKWGVRVNETTNYTGETALHRVCERYDFRTRLVDNAAETAALLLKFGADLNARNREGKTPFELLHRTSNRPSVEATARVIIREAVKREALGQPLCEGYKQMVQSRESYSEFDRECYEEIERMRSEKINIEDSAVTFFYLLSIDEEKLAALARNKKIVTAFETSDYLALFRIYVGELTTKFEIAKRRANFLMSVEDGLVDVLGDILPPPIVQKIAAYVKYDDDIIENEYQFKQSFHCQL